MPHDDGADADIAGLLKVHDAYGTRVTYGATTSPYDVSGPTYECWGGVPHVLFPLITCKKKGPAEATFSVPFDTSAYTGLPGRIPPRDLDPQPDFALVAVGFAVEFTPYTTGCRSGGSPDLDITSDDEPGFGCALPYNGGEALLTSTFAGGTFDWHPWSGWDTIAYDPGRDPAYDDTSGAVWDQRGAALIAPPSPAYTDPDPLDPNADHAPYLWNWADVLDQTATIEITGSFWHRIFSPAGFGPIEITVYPYWLVDRPPTAPWMHVL